MRPCRGIFLIYLGIGVCALFMFRGGGIHLGLTASIPALWCIVRSWCVKGPAEFCRTIRWWLMPVVPASVCCASPGSGPLSMVTGHRSQQTQRSQRSQRSQRRQQTQQTQRRQRGGASGASAAGGEPTEPAEPVEASGAEQLHATKGTSTAQRHRQRPSAAAALLCIIRKRTVDTQQSTDSDRRQQQRHRQRPSAAAVATTPFSCFSVGFYNFSNFMKVSKFQNIQIWSK
jgi:hypothetical protein